MARAACYLFVLLLGVQLLPAAETAPEAEQGVFWTQLRLTGSRSDILFVGAEWDFVEVPHLHIVREMRGDGQYDVASGIAGANETRLTISPGPTQSPPVLRSIRQPDVGLWQGVFNETIDLAWARDYLFVSESPYVLTVHGVSGEPRVLSWTNGTSGRFIPGDRFVGRSGIGTGVGGVGWGGSFAHHASSLTVGVAFFKPGVGAMVGGFKVQPPTGSTQSCGSDIQLCTKDTIYFRGGPGTWRFSSTRWASVSTEGPATVLLAEIG